MYERDTYTVEPLVRWRCHPEGVILLNATIGPGGGARSLIRYQSFWFVEETVVDVPAGTIVG